MSVNSSRHGTSHLNSNCLKSNTLQSQAGLETIAVTENPDPVQWFVMRDLKRRNAKLPAYKQLADAGFEIFTPMVTKIIEQNGKRRRVEMPYIQDLLFAHSRRQELDPVVRRTETLQYRYVAGAPYQQPLVVPDRDMTRFVAAVSQSPQVQYFHPTEITPDMLGRHTRVVGAGALDGMECRLLSIKGSRKTRLLVELPGLLSASIEISPDYIELI